MSSQTDRKPDQLLRERSRLSDECRTFANDFSPILVIPVRKCMHGAPCTKVFVLALSHVHLVNVVKVAFAPLGVTGVTRGKRCTQLHLYHVQFDGHIVNNVPGQPSSKQKVIKQVHKVRTCCRWKV